MINKVMEPPWIAYPEFGRQSIGWRMGKGEDYISEWFIYLESCSKDQREAYRNKYPEPEDWLGIYIEDNRG